MTFITLQETNIAETRFRKTTLSRKLRAENSTFQWQRRLMVWIYHFETIAERRQWSVGRKLDNLLPKLQGKAGDIVFSQLTKDNLGFYGELVKELNNRFRMNETEKGFCC